MKICDVHQENFTFVSSNTIKQMIKYQCTVCGFVYDPEEGDPDGGIAPGTAFEDIPDNWHCPVCGVSKSDFEPID